ncbi:37S ribosomal protein RSM18, mitochondrial [Cytospora mali]|uniref:Small ribosomal subunit protein bS18m n=1 Tax=Cytospora mali TaxID=578113 RepID=A0A194UUT9_CYTMA|nr:37S ribosomal protein RSM18, mitochondrial [Valsa mali var. pyri (nom. inval.)]
MPPRLSLRPLARQCQSYMFQQRTAISSTPKNDNLKFTDSSASKALMDIDDESSSSRSSTNASAGPNIFNNNNPPSSPNGANSPTPMDVLYDVMETSRTRDKITANRQTLEERTKAQTAREELARQMTRNWKPGDVYAPHDLSPVEMLKWRQPKQPSKDIIDMLGLNPLDHYRNFSIISEFMTSMGRIKHSKETGLRPVNQRKMAKAIRRAIGMGIHPSTHRHPMILFRETQSAPRYQNTKIPEPDRTKIKPM